MTSPKVLVTRPQPDAADTAARLDALGLTPVIAPLLEMQLRTVELPDAGKFAALVLTSANALRALEQQGTLDHYLHLPVFTVGDRTATHARNAGFEIVTSADGSFEDLVTLLAGRHFDGPLFYPTGIHVAHDLAEALKPAGIDVHPLPVYDMKPVTALPDAIATDIESGALSAVLHYSRRTAEIFCQLASEHLAPTARDSLTMLCLSENVAAPLMENRYPRISLADYPSEEAMMALALSFARGQTGP